MPKPSRQMPKLKRSPASPQQKLIGIGFCLGAVYLVWKFPLHCFFFVFGLLGYGLVISVVVGRRHQSKLNDLQQQRAGESIGDFARSLDYRNVDTWVIRAVYEQIQAYVRLGFPLRASDRLLEDLLIDSEDLELELAEEIAERSGRTLSASESNPYYGKVKTMEDLVLFFNAQPKR